MKASLAASLVILGFAATPAAARQLTSVQVHAGWVDTDSIVSGERALPLGEPTVALQPAFDNDIQSYAVRMPYGVDGVTLVVERSAFFGGDQFGIVDFNGAGGHFRGATYQQERTFGPDEIGAVFSFRLEPGDNRLRLGYRSTFGDTTVYVLTITRPVAASDDTTLAALAIGAGELSPAFDPRTRTYRTRIVGNGLTVTAMPRPNTRSVTVTGAAADGTALDVDGDSVSGLMAGENTIAIAVEAEDGSRDDYILVVDAVLSSDTTLAALDIHGGELSPAFEPGIRAYRTRIVGNALTVTPIPATGAVSVMGASADGAALTVDGVSVSGLRAGNNTIEVAVRAQDGGRGTYTLVVEVSDAIREVAEGVAISRPPSCDSDVGCDGTLNGVEGRFACDGVDWRSESSNARLSVSGLCLLSTRGGVVTNAAGWYFAAFP